MTDLPTRERLDYDSAVKRAAEETVRLLKEAPAVIRPLTTHLAKAAGKLIRARALLACAIGGDGSISPDAVRAAAAVELLHLATLVHDDIIDDADKRRGIATLHRKFGDRYAVLCGDYLFCAALEFVSGAEALENRAEAAGRVLPRYLTEVCLGELRQNRNHENYRMSEREYFKIIGGKTAALFEASFYAGFLLSGEDDAGKTLYTEIGSGMGLIFQLCDDCADYAATRKMAKKPVLSDYSRGVVTLPLIYALKKDKRLMERIEAGMEPEALRAAVAAAGGLDYTRAKINALYEKTMGMLRSPAISAQKRELLTGLLNKAAGKAEGAATR